MAVLPRMKCPHRLEPHQIQGLDFIHIYPVIQWLVKLAIATREEMGDYIRAFSESQFSKEHITPEVRQWVWFSSTYYTEMLWDFSSLGFRFSGEKGEGHFFIGDGEGRKRWV